MSVSLIAQSQQVSPKIELVIFAFKLNLPLSWQTLHLLEFLLGPSLVVSLFCVPGVPI